MESIRVTEAWICLLLLMLWVRCAASVDALCVCPTESVADLVLGFQDTLCFVSDSDLSHEFLGVIEGDEVAMHRALNMVHKGSHEYVAMLLYASWCPFSRRFRPSFSIMSSLYPSIPHFAIEESAIRPSILSKYGVHGFPSLLLLNSTMHARYHGSRSLGSLVALYTDVTGIKISLLDRTSLDAFGLAANHENHNITEQESCPFSWARCPDSLLHREMYLALASAFVLLRLLYFFPTLLVCVQCDWGRYIRNMRLQSLLEHPLAYLTRAIQLFDSLKERYKRSNLQEGARNARIWAKSLATVSIGDATTS